MQPTTTRRVLFAHDGPLEIGPDGVARGVHYTNSLIDRYLALGDSVSFLMRTRMVSAKRAEQYTPLSRPEFQYFGAPDIKGPVKIMVHSQTLKKCIKDHVSEHDVFVVRLPSAIGRRVYHQAIRQGKPVLVEFVACPWDAHWNHSFLGKLSAPYYFLKNRALLRQAAYVQYVTSEFLQRRYPTNGLATACSDVQIQVASLSVIKRRLKRISALTASSRLVLTTVAAVDVKYKDQATVLRAIAYLAQSGRRFHYRIIGQGKPAGLKRLTSELGLSSQVEFVGPVPHSQITEWLDDSDLYIQPSRQEGLPRALIEAMCRGCLGFGSTAGGIPELLPSDHIFPKGGYLELANLLSGVTPEQMRRDARRNFKVATQYDTDNLNQVRANFYKMFLTREFPDIKQVQHVTT